MSTPKLLFITSPEAGQANVHLAVISSILRSHSTEVEIHLASYQTLGHRVHEGVAFHPVIGKGIAETLLGKEGNGSEAVFDHVNTKPGFWGSIGAAHKALSSLHLETPEEYIATAKSYEKILDDVEPHLIVMDPLCDAARDAALKLGKKQVTLSPNTFKEAAFGQQGLGMFKLPTLDPELYRWVQGRPTILVVLGSHFFMSERYATEMLASFRVLLDIRKDVQILWKIRKMTDYELEGADAAGDRIRMTDWLEVDPLAVLQTGNVVCFVNHGGSNSYHEGLASGVPQVVMPAWHDCYDFASRVGYLGNGMWGNPTAAPYCSEKEFTNALLTVVGRTSDAPEALKFRARAEEVKNVVTQNGTRVGRDVAAERIWEEMTEKFNKRKQ